MELHSCLWNDVDAFSFSEEALLQLTKIYPSLGIRRHQNIEDFLKSAHLADFVLTWDFEESWYAACPRLKAVFTPAAGNEWVKDDPNHQVDLIHGTFHGPILAESLLSAMLFMNHKMPLMIRNHQARAWGRNLQSTSRLLANQKVLIIGLGNIGMACAKLIQAIGAEVIGLRRNPKACDDPELTIRAIGDLNELLPFADHVVLLLPGSTETDRFMNSERLSLMKSDSIIYNFGRGNALSSMDLLAALPQLGGAFLDVTDEEPLAQNSPLWDQANVMITPHSSCIYSEYTTMFIDEVGKHLKGYF